MQGQLEGQQIGRYLIRQRIGGGGVASVYQAYDQVSGQSVALKVLPPNPDPATLDRFRREALRAGSLRHPHIVRILQVGTAAGGSSAYIAMDLIEGESLATLLSHYGQLRPEESCSLLEPIAQALAFAHSHGVVHRDVKPSNILLRPVNLRPDSPTSIHGVRLETVPHAIVPMLSDFGIARYLDMPELTNEGRTVGTPAFMAPEQCMGSREVDGRADIYSLGTVLYRCVTGRLPFSGSTTQILHAHVFEAVVIDEQMARTLPSTVLSILQRTLAKAPEDRYQSADELAEALAVAGKSAENSQSTGANGEATRLMIPTATMTLPQMLPMMNPAAPRQVGDRSITSSGAHVLVPATKSAVAAVEVAVKAPRNDAKIAVRRRGPKWGRVLWAAFFVLLIGGGGVWSANSWFRERARQEGEQLTLPPLVLVTFTPAPAQTLQSQQIVNGAVTPTLEPPTAVAVAPTLTPIPSATPTSVPTMPPTPLPVADPPTVAPTAIPTTEPTDAPQEVPAVTVPTAEPTPAQEIAGACAMVADEFFLPSVAQLIGPLQNEFACPTAPARSVVGRWLPFARGTMVAIEGDPLVYVYYENGTWEQVPRGEGELPQDSPGAEARVDRPLLPLPFAQVLATNGRHLLLGEPLQTEPMQSETLIQPFFGGIAMGNRSSGQILFLARSNLRF